MSDLVGPSLPAFFCAAALFAASSFFCFRLFVDRSNPAYELNPAARQATSTLSDQAQKLPQSSEGWWTDATLFQLERRAIFSQTWVCVSHRGRFSNPGDYVSYELASFRFFLVLGKDDIVRGFHNVCRHRAFPVTQKASGSSTIFGCKYHGWSYDTKGQLTKAPQFDHIPGFEKSQNSLFQIHTKVDDCGFIHINLSGNPDVNDSQIFYAKNIGRPDQINIDSQFIYSWEFKGNFNWKVIVNDPFQSGTTIQQTLIEVPRSGIFWFLFDQYRTYKAQLRFFPITTVYTEASSPFWYQVTYYPHSPQQTTLRCDLYATKRSNTFHLEEKTRRSLESQIKSSITYYEKSYDKLVGSKYDLSDNSDQARVAEAMKIHLEKEKIEGREVNPATVQQCRSATFAQAEGLYQKLECGSDKLDW